MIDYLLTKGSGKYELIFYDNIYSLRFGEHFLNLRDYLTEEYINMYDERITSQTCVYNDKLVGLVNIL